MTPVGSDRAPRVLVLSRNYPNTAIKLLGLWVRETVRNVAPFADQVVVSPVPYCPPISRLSDDFTRFRRVPRRRYDGEIEVHHPRIVVPPGSKFAPLEALSYYASVAPLVARLRRRFPFDLIHAHFSYPDGVVAALLARKYDVPVVITEQAPWGPWLDAKSLVKRQAVWAARRAAAHIAISAYVRRSILEALGDHDNLVVVPDGVDGDVFTLPPRGTGRVDDRILFVGAIRPVKGMDVLLAAMRDLVSRGRNVRLAVVGEGHFRSYRREQDRLEREAGLDDALADRVEFLGRKPVSDLVRLMQTSAAVVLPSRAESLGMVLIEALACGTPVVATRCGGPEDIVTDAVGELVPPEDPEALADAIARVLDGVDTYERAALRAHALERFGIDRVVDRLLTVYGSVLGRVAAPAPAAPLPMNAR